MDTDQLESMKSLQLRVVIMLRGSDDLLSKGGTATWFAIILTKVSSNYVIMFLYLVFLFMCTFAL